MNSEGALPVPVASREAFWTVAVGVPAVLSVLRLWVESGGELQTTLLLVSYVGPLNLIAALFATTIQLVTAVLIAIFAAGSILRTAVSNAAERSPLRERPPLIVRFMGAPPSWMVLATVLLALLTWRIMYLPLLLPACVAIAQRPPWTWNHRWQVALAGYLTGFGVYLWFVGPPAWSALLVGEWQVCVLLILPPLVALGVSGSMLDWGARIFAGAVSTAILLLIGLFGWATVNAPILPLVVTELPADVEPRFLRGHVITVDDKHVVFLLERGGVRYLRTEDVQSTVLCATPEELPAFTTRVRDYHVEDSLLSALGRRKRPRVEIDPLCRITSSETLHLIYGY